jgi:hypothetical protein
MTERDDDEGPVFDIDIEYTYRVADTDYRGKRVRYYKLWDDRWVSEFVQQHPPETQLPVYYDPANPSDAVLIQEPDGGLLWMAMFLLPFNLVMVALPAIVITVAWRGGKSGGPPFVLFEKAEKTHVRWGGSEPAVAAFFTLLVGAFVTAVCIALCVGACPSVETMAIAWVVLLSISFLVTLRVWRLEAAGKYDLVLDHRAGTLTLPIMSRTPVTIPLSAITSVEVTVVRNEKENTTRFAPTVWWCDPDGKLHDGQVAVWDSDEEAQMLVAWIGFTTGCQVSPEQKRDGLESSPCEEPRRQRLEH